MEPVTVKFEDGFLQDMQKVMKKHRYITKAEFVREAVREKIKDLEKEELLQKVEKLFSSSKRKTTDEQLHSAGEKAIKQLEKKFKARKSTKSK